MNTFSKCRDSLGSWIKEQDQLGYAVTINYDKSNATLKSVSGGFISIIFTLLFWATFGQYFQIMISRRAAITFEQYNNAGSWNDNKHIVDVNLGENEDSFGFFFGILLPRDQFNWFNNPYIQPNVYIFDSKSYQARQSKDIKLIQCPLSRQKDVNNVGKQVFIGNEICFEDLSKINLTRSYTAFDAEFENLFISLDQCDSNSYDGECKSDQEIDQFLQSNSFYFVNKKLTVDRDMFKDNPGVDTKYSRPKGDIDSYFPLINSPEVLMYNSIPTRRDHLGNQNIVQSLDLLFQPHYFIFDDSYIQIEDFTWRERYWIGLKRYMFYDNIVSFFSDPSIQNKPRFITYLLLDRDTFVQKRWAVDFLSVLGYSGGLLSIFTASGQTLVYLLQAVSNDLQLISNYSQNDLLDLNKSLFSVKKGQQKQMLEEMKRLTFKLKMSIYKVVCCSTKLFKCCFWSTKNELDQLKLYNHILDEISDALTYETLISSHLIAKEERKQASKQKMKELSHLIAQTDLLDKLKVQNITSNRPQENQPSLYRSDGNEWQLEKTSNSNDILNYDQVGNSETFQSRKNQTRRNSLERTSENPQVTSFNILNQSLGTRINININKSKQPQKGINESLDALVNQDQEEEDHNFSNLRENFNNQFLIRQSKISNKNQARQVNQLTKSSSQQKGELNQKYMRK